MRSGPVHGKQGRLTTYFKDAYPGSSIATESPAPDHAPFPGFQSKNPALPNLGVSL